MKPVAVVVSNALNRARHESENFLPVPFQFLVAGFGWLVFRGCVWPCSRDQPLANCKCRHRAAEFFFFEFIWLVGMVDVSGARPPANTFLTCQADGDWNLGFF
jgi:hypothetical protein